MTLSVLIVDDHPMFRWGVRQYISTLPDYDFAGEAADGNAALSILDGQKVDIVILDLEMPGLDGVGFVNELNKRGSDKPRVIILSQTAGEPFRRKLQAAGIDGYILKTEGIGEIANALSALRQGESYFSPGIARKIWEQAHSSTAEPQVKVSDREREIANLISQGLSTQSISDILGCAPSTVKTHRSNLMLKIGAKNSAEVTRWVTSGENTV